MIIWQSGMLNFLCKQIKTIIMHEDLLKQLNLEHAICAIIQKQRIANQKQ